MAKDKNEYRVLKEKSEIPFGTKIYVSIDKVHYSEHVVRRKYNFESDEEYNDYIKHWIKPMLEGGNFYKLIS